MKPILQVKFPKLLQSLKLYGFEGVDETQMTSLLKNERMVWLFMFLDELISSLNQTSYFFPDTWLISSIDKTPNGDLRYPTEKGNHRSGRAVDLVPLNKDLQIRMLALNRNTLMHDIFVNKFKRSKYMVRLPLIVFEGDHLHVDVNHPSALYRLKKYLPYLDDKVYAALSALPEPLKSQLMKNALVKLA